MDQPLVEIRTLPDGASDDLQVRSPSSPSTWRFHVSLQVPIFSSISMGNSLTTNSAADDSFEREERQSSDAIHVVGEHYTDP